MEPARGRGFAARHRFGRVGRIPTPTPFPVGDINSYLIFPPAGGDGLTLIDTGVRSPEAFDALCHGFKEFGVALEQIERILITHAHMDHFGQAKRLRDLSGAPVFASHGEAPMMRSCSTPSADRRGVVIEHFRRWGVPEELIARPSPMKGFADTMQEPIEPDVLLDDGDAVAVGDLRLEVIHTPGHCDGHIVFWEPELRLLFSGDHLLTDISPVPLLSFPKRPGEERPRSLARFMDSLARVEPLDCALTFPSHGDVIADHRKVIDGYRLHHERRKLQIRRTLARGERTPFALARRLFPKYWESQSFLVMSEVIGHLDLLELDGDVVLEERDGVQVATLAPGAREADRCG
ncbi:MAG: MBL fold metallo-hydrolase [Myxococcota bacterium]|nr:MBL fold metallo-hydrolase [Myxococcota bacterium]